MTTSPPTSDATTDRLHRLRLLAAALSGRPLEVSPLRRGGRPWTDGTTVYLDPDADGDALHQGLAVQAALVRAGSLAPEIVRTLRGRRRLTRRYLGIEAHRALAAAGDLIPDTALSLIDHAIASSSDTPETSLHLAEATSGRTAVPAMFGTIRPARIVEGRDTDGSSDTTPGAGQQSQPAVLTLLEDPDEDDDDPRHLGHRFQSPVGGGGPIGRLLQRLTTPSRSKDQGGGPVGGDAPTHAGWFGEPGRGTVVLGQRVPEVDRVDDPASSGTATYWEWDERRGRYRPDWCTVIEVEADPEDRRPMAAPGDLGLRRPLARLGIGLERQRRMPQGDDLDLDAMVEAQIQAVAGAPIPDGVYIETLRRRRDLSVLVLLDISGSAGEPAPGARTVHDHQRAAAAGLTAVLHELGDRVALYAFNSRGRTAVQVTPVKRFGDPFDSGVQLDLGGLVPAAYTRIGAAIRHGTRVITDEGGTPRRLLVVLSDGFAYDSGYEGAYGEADARRALAEARRGGVGCICLSVGAPTEPAALRRVFGTAAHASVPTAEQLSRVVAPLVAAALRSAEAERRVFQRTERTRHLLDLERLPA